jgi:hypothetical protein
MYKAKSITNKASSAVKMNMALVEGQADIGNVKKAGAEDLLAGMKKTKGAGLVQLTGTDTTGTTEETEEKEDSVNKMKSPFKIDPVTAMKVVGMASSMMGKKKENSGGGSKTTVVVNQPSGGNQKRGGQADNAIDPK